MRILRRLASISLLLLLVLTGCTGSESIVSGSGQLTAELFLDPAVGPRDGSKPPFLYARANIGAVTFTPVDPGASISLYENPLQALVQEVETSLATTGAQLLGTVSVGKGAYKVDTIYIPKFGLNTADEPPITPPRCSDGALRYANFGFPDIPIESKRIVPSSQPVFEILGETARVIRFTIDGAALTALLESHVTCHAGSDDATVTPLSADELSPLITVQLR
jgi:hypothetical protein